MFFFTDGWWHIRILVYTVAIGSQNIRCVYTRCIYKSISYIYSCIYYVLYVIYIYIYCRAFGVKMLLYAAQFSPNPKPPLKYWSFPVILHCPRRSLGLGLTYLGRCKEHGTKWRFQGWIYQPVFIQCLGADIPRKPGRMKQHAQNFSVWDLDNL